MKQTITLIALLFVTTSFAQNVGIGETSPTEARLQVRSGDSALFLLHSYPRVQPGNTNPIKTGLFFKTYDNYTGSIATIGLSNVYRLGFFTNAGPSPNILAERMSILDGGNVGIGNTSPSYKLDVAGNFRTATTAQIGGLLSANNGLSVFGSAAVNGNITATGKLDVNGLADLNIIKIAGGGPSANKVLSSVDNEGNATWLASPNNSGFFAKGNDVSLPYNSVRTITYIISGVNTFRDNGAVTTGQNAESVIAPADGVYHFDFTTNIRCYIPQINSYCYPTVSTSSIKVGAYLNGSATPLAECIKSLTKEETIDHTYNLNFTLKLKTGDNIVFKALQVASSDVFTAASNTTLSGFRLY